MCSGLTNRVQICNVMEIIPTYHCAYLHQNPSVCEGQLVLGGPLTTASSVTADVDILGLDRPRSKTESMSLVLPLACLGLS